jgi:DNA-binding NarL/FixJ family response regulator
MLEWGKRVLVHPLTMSASMIRVTVADDHAFLRRGLVHFLETEDGIRVVAECSDGLTALQAIEQEKPDVAILDLRMPRMGGLELLREARRRNLASAFVLLVGNISEEETMEALRLGVRGVVLKEMAPELLVQCIRKVHAGGQWIEKDSIGRILERMLHAEEVREVDSSLTPREREVVEMVIGGASNRAIADRLFISVSTVKSHLHTIYDKIGVTGRLQLSVVARERKLV